MEEQKKTNVVLRWEDYAKVKRLFAVTSNDETRKNLTYVHYNASEKRVEATDGHLIRIEDMDLGEKDLLLSDMECLYSIGQAKRMAVVGLDIAEKDEPSYPVIQKVIPSEDRHAPWCLRVGVKVLQQFLKSIDPNEYENLTFICCGNEGTSYIGLQKAYIRVDGHFKFIGGIMPLRFDSEEGIEKFFSGQGK